MQINTRTFNRLVISGVFFTLPLQAMFLPVCERTEAVKKGLELSTKKSCEIITEDDLLTVKRISLSGKAISSFKEGDFTGLKNLEILNIRSNPYTELPEGLFQDLRNLKTLVIISTKLTRFPEDFLKSTPLITNLHVFRNKVTQLSENNFTHLVNATELKVIDIDGTIEQKDKDRLRLLFPANGVTKLFFR